MLQVDVDFNQNSRPRRKLVQIGSAIRGGWYKQRPTAERLREYEFVARYDSTVSMGFRILIDTLLSMLGKIEHVDPEIQHYLRYNIDWMQDTHGTDVQNCLREQIDTAMWAGYSVAESLLDAPSTTLLFKDSACYHPNSIIIRTNKKGQLTEGEDVFDLTTVSTVGFKSGIYQFGYNQPEVQLPLWKTCLLTTDPFHGNYYGRSLVDPIYKWHLLKEALIDMWVQALDRFGNPLIAISVPLYNTGEEEVDPNTGQVRKLTTQELIERQFRSQQFGGGNVLLIPQVDRDLKATVTTLTTGNNIGQSFQVAIDYIDREITKNLLLPFTMTGVSGSARLPTQAAERQMELFTHVLTSLYRRYVIPFVSQTFHRLVKYSFNRESAQIAPYFPLRPSTRPEDRVALMQMIDGLTEHGYLDPREESDWANVRQMVNLNDRLMTDEDRKFIEDILVTPRLPDPNGEGGPTTRKKNPNRPIVRGQGGAGRPVGSSTPQSNTRV